MKKVTGNWAELRILPGRLTKLVVERKAKIIGKDEFGRRLYEMDEDVQRTEAMKSPDAQRR